jgi:hypothetical protein
VNLGPEEECHSFALHVRGGDAAVGAVAAILRWLNLRALDPKRANFLLRMKNSIESSQRWKKYRDDVTRPNTI